MGYNTRNIKNCVCHSLVDSKGASSVRQSVFLSDEVTLAVRYIASKQHVLGENVLTWKHVSISTLKVRIHDAVKAMNKHTNRLSVMPA